MIFNQLAQSESSGASNIVSGTFTTGSTADAVETVSVPYEGDGWPIAVTVFADGGIIDVPYDPSAAACIVSFLKIDPAEEPTYQGDADDVNGALGVYVRKGSSANRIGGTTAISNSGVLFSQADPTSAASNVTRMPDATTIKYYVQSTGYGMAPSTTYRYVIAYSE